MEAFKPAFKIGGFIMLLWGIAMLIPLVVASSVIEVESFIRSAALCFILAFVFTILGRGSLGQIKPRSLFLVTSINWLLLCITGALPFMLSQLHLSFANALFESVSGVTTTGSTVLVGLDTVPRSLILWRSILNWIGGVGIILMAVAVLPFLKVGGMRLFKTESSEWSNLEAGRVGSIASRIGLVYLCISMLCVLTYFALGMSWFEALNHAMATVSTGGYSTSDLSFGYFNNSALLWAGCLFMLLGGCPFLLFVNSLKKKSFLILMDKQVQLLLKVVAIATLMITAVRFTANPDEGIYSMLSHTAFNTISIITTTGFVSEDYSLWGSFPVLVLGFLMFSGACSGSTSGGIKLFRFQLLAIFMREHIIKALHPHARLTRRYNDRPVTEEVMVASLAYLFFVIMSWALISLILATIGLDPITATTASLTALMNVGPGFGPVIGPAGNFSSLPDLAKYILSIAMLLGRLEYLALVIVFTRVFWKW